MKKSIILLTIIISLFLTGCTGPSEKEISEAYLMGILVIGGFAGIAGVWVSQRILKKKLLLPIKNYIKPALILSAVGWAFMFIFNKQAIENLKLGEFISGDILDAAGIIPLASIIAASTIILFTFLFIKFRVLQRFKREKWPYLVPIILAIPAALVIMFWGTAPFMEQVYYLVIGPALPSIYISIGAMLAIAPLAYFENISTNIGILILTAVSLVATYLLIIILNKIIDAVFGGKFK